VKALVYCSPRILRLLDMPDPAPTPDAAAVRVEAVGICGSDLHGYLGHDERRPPPLILGHEASGTVVSGRLKGRRVAVNPLVACGDCRQCQAGTTNICQNRQLLSMPPREGGFAEYLQAPEGNLVELPDAVPCEHGALVEPLAVGWHAVRQASRNLRIPLSEARCRVLGGGAIGLAAALSLRAQGATGIRVSEPNPARREFLAERSGFAIDAGTSNAPADAGSADLVIDSAGSVPSRKASCQLARPGGAIVHVGLHSDEGGIDVRRLTLQEIRFQGVYAYTDRDFLDAASALFDGRFGPMDWFETRPLAAGAKAFEDLLAGRVARPKIVLKP